MNHIETIISEINPLKFELLQHPIYDSIKTVSHLRIFMEHHVYAVWDFMSLVKKLQSTFTRVQEPWFAIGDADIRYLINEIVLGEESDIDEHGNRTSHFELYLKAMHNAGANTSEILSFYENIASNMGIYSALDISVRNDTCKKFVKNTFETIRSNNHAAICGSFTLGREDLIPDMFHNLVKNLDVEENINLNTFIYYLKRHIEIDGDHHKHLAHKMLESVCKNDIELWRIAKEAAIKSLESRRNLWDEIHYKISNS